MSFFLGFLPKSSSRTTENFNELIFFGLIIENLDYKGIKLYLIKSLRTKKSSLFTKIPQMQTTTQTPIEIPQNLNLINAAGICFKSIPQANSLFTITALFKDNTRTRLHSWRQEVKGKDQLCDQRHAYERLKMLSETCKCTREPESCFACNHCTILIYCNITDTVIYKSVYKKIKSIADLNFMVAESGSTYLCAVNNVNTTKLAIAHSKMNRIYFNNNK